VTTAFVDSRLSIVSTAHYILPGLIAASLISVVLISIATAAVVVYLSHRIAGPLFHIERSVREIAKGNMGLNIKLRSTDEIVKIKDCINEMTYEIRTHIADVRSASDELGQAMSKLDKDFAKGKLSEEEQKVLLDIKQRKTKIDSILDYFKL
jgi:methyl-accepting chemotaxis protein